MTNVIVTAGGTREDIDEVRFLTNVSTGKLGALIADYAHAAGFNVVFVCTESSMRPRLFETNIVAVRSTQEAYDLLEKRVPEADAIVHAMACGDFGFKPTKLKLKSNSAEDFIESLRERIVVNPKILNMFKKWNNSIYVVSFKFETGKSIDELCAIARASMSASGSDMVIANDKEMMKAAGTHVAYAITDTDNDIEILTKENIARYIVENLKAVLW